MPSDWGLIAGDFAHNLRSALDHLVWQLALLSGANPGRDNQFPICRTRESYWRSKKPGAPSTRDRMLKGVPEKYRAPIDAVQPYQRGDNPELSFLAGLNDLSNFDKHRVIQTAFSATLEPTPEDLDVISSDDTAFVQITTTPGTRLENGAEVMRTRIITGDPNTKVRMRANLPIAVGFGETRISIEGLGPLYEFVRDYLKSFAKAFG